MAGCAGIEATCATLMAAGIGVPEVPAAAILANLAGVNAVPKISPFRRIIRRMGGMCIYGRFWEPVCWISLAC
jgi:hypothetical protein